MKRLSRMSIVPVASRALRTALYCAGLMLLSAGAALAADEAPKQILIEVAKQPPAPDFALVDLDGRKHRLSEMRGKVVLVNFWATWCPPCRREMPSIERLSHALKQADFRILAVNVAETPDDVFSFTSTLDPMPTFPIVFDRDSKALKAWPVRGLPTTFVVDKKGRIVFRAVGGREFDDPAILAQLRTLLEAQ